MEIPREALLSMGCRDPDNLPECLSTVMMAEIEEGSVPPNYGIIHQADLGCSKISLNIFKGLLISYIRVGSVILSLKPGSLWPA